MVWLRGKVRAGARGRSKEVEEGRAARSKVRAEDLWTRPGATGGRKNSSKAARSVLTALGPYPFSGLSGRGSLTHLGVQTSEVKEASRSRNLSGRMNPTAWRHSARSHHLQKWELRRPHWASWDELLLQGIRRLKSLQKPLPRVWRENQDSEMPPGAVANQLISKQSWTLSC